MLTTVHFVRPFCNLMIWYNHLNISENFQISFYVILPDF